MTISASIALLAQGKIEKSAWSRGFCPKISVVLDE
jgi:hypothetical protein